jgi:hypothetical protein
VLLVPSKEPAFRAVARDRTVRGPSGGPAQGGREHHCGAPRARHGLGRRAKRKRIGCQRVGQARDGAPAVHGHVHGARAAELADGNYNRKQSKCGAVEPDRPKELLQGHYDGRIRLCGGSNQDCERSGANGLGCSQCIFATVRESGAGGPHHHQLLRSSGGRFRRRGRQGLLRAQRRARDQSRVRTPVPHHQQARESRVRGGTGRRHHWFDGQELPGPRGYVLAHQSNLQVRRKDRTRPHLDNRMQAGRSCCPRTRTW